MWKLIFSYGRCFYHLHLLQFEIRPHGEIYLDGSMKGPTPPLAQLEVSPGLHTVEVRNGAFPPLRVRIHLAQAEEMTIRHTFVAPKPRPAPPRKKPKKEAKKEPEKESRKEASNESAQEQKKDINWGEDIKHQFEIVRRKLGL